MSHLFTRLRRQAINKALPSLVGDARERALSDTRLQLVAQLGAAHLLPLLRRAYRRDFPAAPLPAN